MKKINIREVIIGDGTIKICYPITGANSEEVLAEAEEMKKEPCDLVEWRIDFFKEAQSQDKVISLLPQLRQRLGEKPILFVYRTAPDGGLQDPSEEYYFRLNKAAIDTGCVDIVDIELEKNGELVEEFRQYAQNHDVKMLISKHVFEGTPESGEMEELLRRIRGKGADICKLAVMAKKEDDAQQVMAVAEKLWQEPEQTPIIAVAMGKEGQQTRKLKPFFGSSITYARGRNSVSPGQLTIKELLRD